MMATYGEGDPTDNAQEFIDWLKEGNADLTGLRYAVSWIATCTTFQIAIFLYLALI